MNPSQKNFLEKYVGDVQDPKLKIIKLAVELYVDEQEKKRTELEKALEAEKAKNKDVKELAEQLARELLSFSPTHPLAEETLALLLENKMRPGDSSDRKRKRP